MANNQTLCESNHCAAQSIELRDVAAAYCSECSEHMCTECIRVHDRVGLTSDHHVTNIKTTDYQLKIDENTIMQPSIEPHELQKQHIDELRNELSNKLVTLQEINEKTERRMVEASIRFHEINGKFQRESQQIMDLISQITANQLNSIEQRAMKELNDIENIEKRLPSSDVEFQRVLFETNNEHDGESYITDLVTLQSRLNDVKSFLPATDPETWHTMRMAIENEYGHSTSSALTQQQAIRFQDTNAGMTSTPSITSSLNNWVPANNKMQLDTNEELFPCDKCVYLGTKKKYLAKHQKSHSEDRPFPCTVCDYKAKHHGHLRRHKLVVHGIETLPNNALLSSNLHHHENWRNQLRKLLKCDKCSYSTRHSDHFKNHIMRHNGIRPFKCSLCNFKGTVRQDLTRHQKRKHADQPATIVRSVSHHQPITNIDPVIPGKYQRQADSSTLLSVVDKSKDQSFFSTRTETSASTKTTYSCLSCDFTTDRRRTLTIHERVHGSESRAFRCGECDHTASTEWMLKVHMCGKSEDRHFNCDKCDYKAKSKHLLVSHMRRHSDKRPFKCDQCEYASRYKHAFRDHYDTHHNCADNEHRQFNCDKCDYKTKYRHSLTGHMRIHSKKLPFKCNECDYATKYKHALLGHYERHHK